MLEASSWAEDDFESRLTLVADSISRAAVRLLIGLGPALRRSTVSGRADFARALLASLTINSRVHSNADIILTAFHNANVVSRAVQAIVLTIPELEQGLVLPLRGDALFGVGGDAHAGVFEGRGDGLGGVGGHGEGVHALEHLEGGCDLVHAEVLGAGALVADFDAEGVVGGVAVRAAGVGVVVLVVVGDWGGCDCCRQGDQGAEEQACGVHLFWLSGIWCGLVWFGVVWNNRVANAVVVQLSDKRVWL
jgi:hypothetical protein